MAVFAAPYIVSVRGSRTERTGSSAAMSNFRNYVLFSLFSLLFMYSAISTVSSDEGQCPTCAVCDVCEDTTIYKTEVAQKDEQLSKVLLELDHIKRTHEQSVEACADVSKKQVESLMSCQEDAKTLGDSFNALVKDKSFLADKIEEMNASLNTITAEHETKLDECKNNMNVNSSEMEKNLVDIETKLKAKTSECSTITDEYNAVAEKMKDLAARASRLDELEKTLSENTGKIQTLEKKASEGAVELTKTIGKLAKTQEKSDRLEQENDKLRSKMNAETDTYILSYKTVRKSALNVYVLLESLCIYGANKVPQSYYDDLTNAYTEFMSTVINPYLVNVKPLFQRGLETITALTDSGLDHYKRSLHPIVMTQKKKTQILYDAVYARLSANSSRLNDYVSSALLKPFTDAHPNTRTLLPSELCDRLLSLLFVLVTLYYILYILRLIISYIFLPVLCRFVLCGKCLRRKRFSLASSKDGKKATKDKKRAVATPSSNPSPPPPSGNRSFRPDNGGMNSSQINSVLTGSAHAKKK